MGPNETASMIIGGPLKIVIFDVQRRVSPHRRHRDGPVLSGKGGRRHGAQLVTIMIMMPVLLALAVINISLPE